MFKTGLILLTTMFSLLLELSSMKREDKELENDISGIKINDEVLQINVQNRTDSADNNVETLIRFDNPQRNVIASVYKTNFKMTINGKDYKWLVGTFLQDISDRKLMK